nr:hypothetical protein [uncultured Flavobacterium sp.]
MAKQKNTEKQTTDDTQATPINPRFTFQIGEDGPTEYAHTDAEYTAQVEKLKKERTPEFLVIDSETAETKFFRLQPGWKNYTVTTGTLSAKTPEPQTPTPDTPEV